MAGTLTLRDKPNAERTVGRKRKELDPKSTDIRVRFGIRFRALTAELGLDSKEEIQDRLSAHGVAISLKAIEKWLSGDMMPDAGDMERIAAAFIPGSDYRELYPDPLIPSRKRRRA